jgi:hypothetical protein
MSKIQWVYLISVGLFFTACTSSGAKEDTTSDNDQENSTKIELSDLEAVRLEMEAAMPNISRDLYKRALSLHLAFADQNPEHKDHLEILNHALGMCDQLQDFRLSNRIIDDITKAYPKVENRKQLLMVKASNCDMLRDTVQARAVLEEYLKAFSDLSKEEQVYIEEWMKMLPYSIEERILMNN